MLQQEEETQATDKDEPPPQQPKKKGCITGVFVPTCENMWGVLIFLRFYTIVGQAGIWQTLVAVSLSFLAALCTTASMSSIASSGGIVSRGGPYHMISRTMGPVVGVSVGIMYWLAITLLSVLEVLGAVEALTMAAPDLRFAGHMQAIGSGFLAVLALFVWGGINIVTKLGVFFAIIVFYTILSYYIGLITAPHHEADGGNQFITGLSAETFAENWNPHYDSSHSFGTVLALFYPCFTGILSGANRANVLRDPPKDIRRGTFAAVCFSFVMYVSLFLLWGSVADYRYLQGDVGQTHDLAHEGQARRLGGGDAEVGAQVVRGLVWNPFPNSAFIGIIISSLSQSLQCIIVAPRLLQQMAGDKIIHALTPLAQLTPRGEPARALFFTYVVAALLVLIGSLELVAPLLSICFLVAYAFMNSSCFILTWLKSPAWRPKWITMKRWRVFYMITASLGFLVCVAIMVIINVLWALVAWCIALGLYAYVKWKIQVRDWGSAVDGIKYQFALKSLVDLESSQHQCVNWRPQVLILYRIDIEEELNGIRHREILNFYSQLRKSRGFCAVACVLESKQQDEQTMRKASLEKGIIRSIMQEEGIQGFAEVVVAPTWAEGTRYIIQLTGIGGLVPNTVLVDWPEGWAHDTSAALDFASVVTSALTNDKAVLAVKGLHSMPQQAVHGTIDVWWMIHDGGLLILLSWLLSKHRTWRSCHLRVFTVAENVSKERAESAAAMLTRTLRQRRLFDVDVEVILLDDHLIEPYTYDWTLRVEERHRFLNALHQQNRQSLESVPLEIDDLFSDISEEPTPPKSAARSAHTTREAPKSSIGDASPGSSGACEGRIVVSDCRSEAGGASVSTAVPGRMHALHPMKLPTRESSAPAIMSSSSNIAPRAARAVPGANAEAGRWQGLCAEIIQDSAEEATDAASRCTRPLPWGSLETCEKLGQIIFDRSKRAELVVMNLPNLWGTAPEEVQNFMKYCDTLTHGLERVLFVHSTGHEIFDISG